MLADTCPRCGSPRVPGRGICWQCGLPVASSTAAIDAADTAAGGPAGQTPSGPPMPPPPPAWGAPPPPPPAAPAWGAAPPPPPAPLPWGMGGSPAHPPAQPPAWGAPLPGPQPSGRRTPAIVAIALVVVVAIAAGAMQLAGRTGGVAQRPAATPTVAATQEPATQKPAATGSPRPSGLPADASFAPGTTIVRIGVSLPLGLEGSTTPTSVLRGVQLAVDEANAASSVPGIGFKLVVLDHTVKGDYAVDKAVADMGTLVSDETVMGVVGPFNSSVAKAQIPLSNRAHLLQCSPSTFFAELTKNGAAELRPLGMGMNNFIRTIAPDEDEGLAMAHYAYNSLGLRTAAVADDDSPYGAANAAGFAAEFRRLGGSVAIVFTVTDASPAPNLKKAMAKGVDSVYFGGSTDTGGADLRRAMGDLAMDGLPFLTGDGLMDGDGSVGGSYLNVTGTLAAKTYAALPEPDPNGDGEAFFSAYKAAYGEEGSFYAMGGYSCAQVLIASVGVAATGTLSREAVRAAAAGSGRTFDTALGLVTFDAGGDMTPGSMSIYSADLSKPVAAADWSYEQRIPLAKP